MVLQTIALPLGYSAIAGAGASDYVLRGGMSMPGCRRMRKQCLAEGGNGVIQLVLNGPVDEAGASALIESMLGAVPSDAGLT